MKKLDPNAITEMSRALLYKQWSAWPDNHGGQEPNEDQFYPVRVRELPKILGIKLEEPAVIPINPGDGLVEVAGYLDREGSRIVVSEKFPHEIRRFTIAHELGHLLLHDNVTYHRDRPTKGNYSSLSRPHFEVEADQFAAEILMPAKAIKKRFEQNIGNIVDHTDLDLRRWRVVSRPDHNPVEPGRPKRYYSSLLAQTSFFGMNHFTSLAKHFQVSRLAMAIRLEQLGLVR